MLLRRFLTVLVLLGLLLPAGTSRAAEPIILKPTSYLPFVFAPDRVNSGRCQVVRLTPADGSSLPKSTAFETRWMIKNTSAVQWDASAVQVRFISGDRLGTGTDTRDLPFDVAPGEQIEIVVNMHTGDTPGNYTANWALVSGLSPVCAFFINITVI